MFFYILINWHIFKFLHFTWFERARYLTRYLGELCCVLFLRQQVYMKVNSTAATFGLTSLINFSADVIGNINFSFQNLNDTMDMAKSDK